MEIIIFMIMDIIIIINMTQATMLVISPHFIANDGYELFHFVHSALFELLKVGDTGSDLLVVFELIY